MCLFVSVRNSIKWEQFIARKERKIDISFCPFPFSFLFSPAAPISTSLMGTKGPVKLKSPETHILKGQKALLRG